MFLHSLSLTLTPFVESVAEKLGISYRKALLAIVLCEVADLALFAAIIYALVK